MLQLKKFIKQHEGASEEELKEMARKKEGDLGHVEPTNESLAARFLLAQRQTKLGKPWRRNK